MNAPLQDALQNGRRFPSPIALIDVGISAVDGCCRDTRDHPGRDVRVQIERHHNGEIGANRSAYLLDRIPVRVPNVLGHHGAVQSEQQSIK